MSLYENIAVRAERNEILFHLGKATQLVLLYLKGCVSLNRSRLINNYLTSHPIAKLQLGSGTNLLKGWLNTDCSLFFPSDCFLDVTRPFPFSGQTFEYVFTEHLIEHLTYPQGVFMLKESYRVLKPGGKLRVACPDLRIIVQLCSPEKTEGQLKHMKWMVDHSLPEIGIYKESFVINNAFRNWGHKFIYDQETLSASLEKIGFIEVVRREPDESHDPHLRGIESHELGWEVKYFETMVLEAKKPG